MTNTEENKLGTARTIYNQLGYRFIAMTGAKNFTANDDSLSFKIGRNSKNITHVKIRLTALDLYEYTFYKIRKLEIKIVDIIDGIYNDQLLSVFESKTGMATNL